MSRLGGAGGDRRGRFARAAGRFLLFAAGGPAGTLMLLCVVGAFLAWCSFLCNRTADKLESAVFLSFFAAVPTAYVYLKSRDPVAVGRSLFRRGKYAKARKYLEKGAWSEHSFEAHRLLGDMAFHGLGREEDREAALKYYRLALLHAGTGYYSMERKAAAGETADDPDFEDMRAGIPECESSLTEIARAGRPAAWTALAVVPHRRGDFAAAAGLYRQAMAGGDADAGLRLAEVLVENGDSSPEEIEEGLAILEESRRNGDLDSGMRLAELYALGNANIAADWSRAEPYLRDLAGRIAAAPEATAELCALAAELEELFEKCGKKDGLTEAQLEKIAGFSDRFGDYW